MATRRTVARPGWSLILAAAWVALLPHGTSGQEPPEEPAPPASARVAFGGGLGLGHGGPAGIAVLTTRYDRREVILRGVRMSEFFGPPLQWRDAGLLLGLRNERERDWTRVAAGPSLVRLLEHGEPTGPRFFGTRYEAVRRTTGGLAVQVDAILAHHTWFGFGLTAFGNLNPHASFGGAALTLHFGSVR